MKSILLGLGAAVILAIAAYAVLDLNVQQTADRAYRTEGVRL
jgi:hypothetical protein